MTKKELKEILDFYVELVNETDYIENLSKAQIKHQDIMSEKRKTESRKENLAYLQQLENPTEEEIKNISFLNFVLNIYKQVDKNKNL